MTLLSKCNAPAFPVPNGVYEGMTVGEWYASMAMLGAVGWVSHAMTPEEISKRAFDIADAMVSEAERRYRKEV